MGTLVICRIPAAFYSKVDHTYVECGTKRRAWSCFGRKAGGTALRMASGSTSRADAIATPDERGGIRCYAINGVCHQAANRIAYPAGILCIGANGYGLSEAIYGPYGRPSGPLGLCPSPFDQHDGILDDLPQCAERAEANIVQQPTAAPLGIASPAERQYIDRSLQIYDVFMSRPMSLGMVLSDDQRTELGARLLLNKAQFNLRSADARQRTLEEAFRSFDRPRLELEHTLSQAQMSPSQFSVELNQQTVRFQEDLANRLPAQEYEALLDLKPDDQRVLLDPDLVEQVLKVR